MSKSLGNFYTLRDLLDQGYEIRAIKYALLNTHYRKQLNFILADLPAYSKTLEKVDTFLADCKQARGPGSGLVESALAMARQKFTTCLADDLNISGALAAVFELMHEINPELTAVKVSSAQGNEIVCLMQDFDQVLNVFALGKDQDLGQQEDLATEIETKINARQQARQNKNFALADKIRDELLAQGIILKDTKDGVKWEKK
jgi:cysteinyl-tRNA synthetase